jgi:hypothetical protein
MEKKNMKSTSKNAPTKVAPQPMKKITNVSLQSWSIPVRTRNGMEDRYLEPKQTIVVPASYVTETAIRYQERQLIAIKNA